jgi:hypothetical protein
MEETGECGEQELNHSDGQAEKFYRDLKHDCAKLLQKNGTCSCSASYGRKRKALDA